MGSKLLFRFRSGTHGLNEELGRHITTSLEILVNISKACVFCNCDCESVEHVLWECPAYRSVFINSLSKILCSDFHLMSAFEKTSISSIRVFGNVMVTLIIGSQILKAFLCSVWNLSKEKLYPEDSLTNTQKAAAGFV